MGQRSEKRNAFTLTPAEQQVFDLRASGVKLAEICLQLSKRYANVKQLLSTADEKMKVVAEERSAR